MIEPVIIDALRIPVGRSSGALRNIRPDDLYAGFIGEMLRRTGIGGEKIDDVITGCVTQYGEQGANVGRLAVLLSSLPPSIPRRNAQPDVRFKPAGRPFRGAINSLGRCAVYTRGRGGIHDSCPDVLGH